MRSINLPYEIGTMLESRVLTNNGEKRYAKVHHYIISNKIEAVLELDHYSSHGHVYYTGPGKFITVNLRVVCDLWQEVK